MFGDLYSNTKGEAEPTLPYGFFDLVLAWTRQPVFLLVRLPDDDLCGLLVLQTPMAFEG